jgi:hypothetical protein
MGQRPEKVKENVFNGVVNNENSCTILDRKCVD